MKKCFWWIFVMAVFMLTAALAGETMMVVNCNEWVSLREEPSASSARLAKVPLGAEVENCEQAADGFMYCEYEGQSGYIMDQYLEAPDYGSDESWAEPYSAHNVSSYLRLMQGGETLFNENGCSVKTYRTLDEHGELLEIACFRDGAAVWGYSVFAPEAGQYMQTHAFMGVNTVLVYNHPVGLVCLNLSDGEERWTLAGVDLGCSVTAAADEDGTLYAAGCDGPRLVAVSAEGVYLWTAELADPEIYGPYRISFCEDGVTVDYLSGPPEEGQSPEESFEHYAVTYRRDNGHVNYVRLLPREV